MSITSVFTFLALSLSLLSVWIRRDVKIWGGLLVLSLFLGLVEGAITMMGLIITTGWALLWIAYPKQHKRAMRLWLLILFIILSFGFKFHLFPGYETTLITPRFLLGFETPLLGLFPLALLVPLAKSRTDWKAVTIGLLWGILGITILACLAISSGAIQWQFKLPSNAPERFLSNLILTAIPEEAFYRGFLQKELCSYLKNKRGGQWMALGLTSLIFTLAHVYWSPSLDILGFVFLAGLLYGAVYLISKRIESAILCHFLLNFVHMSCFSYHAM